MTSEELAAMLTGREIGNEITQSEEKLAQDNGLLVIFGASDDLVELRGAIDDETSCWDGGEFWIHDGKLVHELDDEERRILLKHGVDIHKKGIRIESQWCEEPGYSWTYKTDVPHTTFEVWEDGEHYCRGIVIDLKKVLRLSDLPQMLQPQPHACGARGSTEASTEAAGAR
jgi:hypothetical protein